jgi:uncharacterized Rmd1/YagE family protein
MVELRIERDGTMAKKKETVEVTMEPANTMVDENREKIIEELKAYCGMDSYAMTVVFRWLKELAGQETAEC